LSREVDTRIVEMRFENSKFEKNVSQTMKSLDKLKEALSFSKVQKSVDNFSFDHLVKSVDKLSETVEHRTGIIGGLFDALGARILGVFENTFGKVQQMINEVTFQPIMTGFSEYELKTNSVQTIAANVGILTRDALEEMGKSGEALMDSSEAMEKAWEIWNKGTYGNGEARKKALGDQYETVQALVNKIANGEIKMGDAIRDTTDALGEQVYTMQDVEDVLDELNEYADKTIYNYAQMTSAIGKLTTAGVDLYESKSVVEGMSNYAAFIGANPEQAAHMMQRVGTSLATGYLSLHDWLSFETVGGFASKEFQDKLIDMAQHMYDTDEAYREYIQARAGAINSIREDIVETKHSRGMGFRYSLSDTQWLSTDVFVNTMHEFANDWSDEMYEALGYTQEEIDQIQAFGQVAYEAATKAKTFHQMWAAVTEAATTSWTTSWEYIFGHFYDARNLWTAVSDALTDIIGGFNAARNEALRIWAGNPLGRKSVLKSLARLWEIFSMQIARFQNIWYSFFDVIDGKALLRLSMRFKYFVDDIGIPKINAFTDLLAKTAVIIATVIEKVAGTFWNIATLLFDNIFTIKNLNIMHRIADALIAFLNAPFSDTLIALFVLLKPASKLLSGLVGLLSGFGGLLTGIVKAIFSPITLIAGLIFLVLELSGIEINGDLIANGLNIIADAMDNFTASGGGLETTVNNIKNLFSTITSIPSKASDKIKSFFGMIKDFFAQKWEAIKNIDVAAVIQNVGEFVKKLTPLLTGLLYAIILIQTIKGVNIIAKIGKMVVDVLDTIKKVVLDIGESVKRMAIAYEQSTLAKLITAISFLFLSITASLFVLSTIPTDRYAEVVEAFMEIIVAIIAMILILRNSTKMFNARKILALSSFIGAIGLAMLELSIGMAILAGLDEQGIAQATIAIIAFGWLLKSVMKTLDYTYRAKHAKDAGVGMAILIASIYPVVLAFNKLVKTLHKYEITPGEALGALFIIAALFAIMLGFSVVLLKVTKGGINPTAAKGILALAGSMIIISIAVSIIMGAMLILIGTIALFGVGKAIAAAVIVGAIMGIMVGLVYELGKAAALIVTTQGVVSIFAMAVFILALSGAMLLIVTAIETLYTIIVVAVASGSEDALAVGAVVIIAILAALVILTSALIKAATVILNPASAAAIGAIGGAILLIAIGITIVIASLSVLIKAVADSEKVSKGAWWKALAVFAGAIVAVVILIIALVKATMPLSATGFQAKKLLSLGATFVLIGKGIEHIAKAMNTMSTIKWNDDWWKTVAVMAGIIVVIGLVIGMVGKLLGVSGNFNLFNNSFNNSTMALGNIGKILTGLGIAVLSIVGAIAVVIWALKSLIEISTEWDAKHGKDKLAQTIIDICQAFTKAEPAIKESQRSLNDLIMDFLIMLIEDVATLLGELVDLLIIVAYDLGRGVADVIIELLNGLAGTDLTTWSEALADGIEMSSFFEDFVKKAKDAPINKLINAIIGIVALVIYGIGDAIVNLAGPLVFAVGHLIGAVLYLIEYILVAAIGTAMGWSEDMINDFMQQYGDKISKAVLAVVATLLFVLMAIVNGLIDVLIGLGLVLIGVGEAWLVFTLGIQAARDALFSWMDETDNMNKTIERLEQMNNTAQSLKDTFMNINGEGSAINTSMDSMANMWKEVFSTDDISAVNDAIKETETTADDLQKKANEGALMPDMTEAGENGAEQYADGMINGLSSTKTGDRIGEAFNQLFDRYSPKIKDASANIFGSFGNEDITNALSLDGAQISLDPEQVLKVDGTEWGTQFSDSYLGGLMNDYYGEYAIQESADIADGTAYQQELADGLEDDGSFYDDSEVTNRMDTMNRYLDQLVQNQNNSQVVLDTGALVGAMTPYLDNSLSLRASRVNRGN